MLYWWKCNYSNWNKILYHITCLFALEVAGKNGLQDIVTVIKVNNHPARGNRSAIPSEKQDAAQ